MQSIIANAPMASVQQELADHPWVKRLLRHNPDFDLYHTGAPERGEVEQHIADVFAEAYGADVKGFAPVLMSMKCAGKVSAAAGIRAADSGPLFMEQYLDAPIEDELARRYEKAVTREEIFELGNLASIRPGISQLFYLILAGVTERTRLNHVVFAGTPQVRKGVARLGFKIETLAPADPARLGDAADNWGSYYDNEPAIMAIDLSASMPEVRKTTLAALLLKFYAPEIEALAQKLSQIC